MPEVSSWSLKFTSRHVEEGYLQRLHAGLFQRGAGILKVVVLARLAILAMHVLQYAGIMGQQPLVGPYRQLKIAQIGTGCATVLLGCLVLLAVRFNICWVRLVRPQAVEAVLVALAVLVMCQNVLSSRQNLRKMLGLRIEDLVDDFAYESDSYILLSILTVCTLMHVVLQLRWCSLLPLELASVALYAASALAIGSSEPRNNVLANTLLMTYIVVMSSFGKRAWELLDRKCFLDMIREKQERCRAEFQLSQVQEGPPGRAQAADPAAPSSSVGSRPVGSSDAFDVQTEMDHSVADHLGHLASMGAEEHWRLDDAQVEVLDDKLLGSGGFGEVHGGIFCGKLVAVKRPRIKAANADVETLRDICNELRVTRHLKHPNIVTTFGAVVQPHSLSIALVMELVDGLRLSDLMLASVRDEGAAVSLAMRFQIMVGVCEALFYMHTRSPSVAHGDLKGANIMVVLGEGTAHPKLLDFGLSRVLTRHARPMGGTLAWTAPEVLTRRGDVKCSADIYSLGHVIAFTATGIPPGLGLAAELIRRALRRSRPPAPKWPRECAFRPSCEPLVAECVGRAEGDRPRIAEIHRRLVSLPGEGALSEMRGPFIDSLRLVAERAYSPTDLAPPRGGPEPPEVVAADGQDSGAPRSSLSPLPEDHATEEGADAAAPPPPRPAKLQPFPALKETCEAARATSLERTLAHWNYQVSSGFCCERHALARLAVDAINQEMIAMPCSFKRLPRPDVLTQCSNCGLLLDEGTAACGVCGLPAPDPDGESDHDSSSSDSSEPQCLRASL